MCHDNSTFVECTLIYVCAGLLLFLLYTAFYAHPHALDEACERTHKLEEVQGRLVQRLETVERELIKAREETNVVWVDVLLHDRNIGGLITWKNEVADRLVWNMHCDDKRAADVNRLITQMGAIMERADALESDCMCPTRVL